MSSEIKIDLQDTKYNSSNASLRASQGTSNAASNSIFENKNNESEYLKKELQNAKDKQGFLGRAWDGFKNLTTLGLSSNDLNDKIEQYENDEITLEEARSAIKSFEEKQDNMVSLFSNTASGLVTVAAISATGGLGALALGAIVGGVSKASIKTLDRATNNIENDALDKKEIIKDTATGAIDGAVSSLTMGIVKPLSTATIAGKSIAKVAATGAVQGATSGAITGATTGGSEYAINCALDEEKDFSLDEFLKISAQNATAGAIFGGIGGGISNGLQYKKVYAQTMDEFQNAADDLAKIYKENIEEITSSYETKFQDASTIEDLSSRAKSNNTNSVFNKLKSKFDDGKLTSTEFEDCAKAIGDGYGLRIKLQNLDEQEARQIIESALIGKGKTYDDFISALQSGEALNSDFLECVDLLKEKQTGEFVDKLISYIESGEISLANDDFNNYGTEITSYFTNEQLERIAKAYSEKTQKPLPIVNKSAFDAKVTKSFSDAEGNIKTQDFDIATFGKKALEKADKESGYTDVQMNLASSSTLQTQTLADTELQIRGEEVHGFAQIEHLFYDLMEGKVDKGNEDYSKICSIVRKMFKSQKDDYYAYIKQTYKVKRLKELGIEIQEPTLSFRHGLRFSQNDIETLSKEGLEQLSLKIAGK